jgi:hypothetical protein
MVDGANLARALRHFALIPDQQMTRLLAGARVVLARKGTLLQRQDEPADWLGFLERGVVRAFCNLDGREITVGFEVDGGFTGAFDAYMQRRPALCSLQAVEASRIWHFPRPLVDGSTGRAAARSSSCSATTAAAAKSAYSTSTRCCPGCRSSTASSASRPSPAAR